MDPPLLKARARLATAAVVLIAAVALLHYDVPPVPTWFYVLAWYPTLVILDQVVVLRGGESLLARPPELAAMLALVLAFPRYLYPLTWGAVWLVVEPLLYRRDPEHSLFGDVARGEWGRIARLMAAGLFAGALWESFNGMARGRWIYTVPFFEHSKIFEMPPVGFIGFPFFALEVWSMFHLIAPRTSRRTLLGSAVFALLVLAGIDRWTVSSTAPQLADLPGVTNGVLQRLAGAGWDDVFRVARTPAAELAYRANLSPADARAAREAARLVTLRGIGTTYAGTLMASGIGSVKALAAADPDTVWQRVRGGPRPTPAEVRVWVRAAQREVGAATRLSDLPSPPR